mgnify:CR=1 FL=1
MTQTTVTHTNADGHDTHSHLLARYGPLLTLEHLAEILHSTPSAVRHAIGRRRQPFTAGLANARRRLGGRLYFETRCVAEVIDTATRLVPAEHGNQHPVVAPTGADE